MNKKYNHSISLCIPRMETSVTKEYINEIFKKINIGQILSIREIPLRNDSKHKRVILTIHINSSPESKYITERLCKNEPINIVHNMPWYWKVVPTHPQK
jgi:hypothetical protein